MLTKDQIENNRIEFLNLLDSITIESADIEGLKNYLIKSDFFNAPASTKYHCSYVGGLCEHSLNVYNKLCELVEKYSPGKYFPDSLKVVALLHDISKTNYYESYVKNINTGKKDEKGKDIWAKELNYKIREPEDRLLLGTHEANSAMIIQRYIPLLEEEIAAVLNHHGGWGLDTYKCNEVSYVFSRYNLAILLHLADLLSVYVCESK